MPPTVNVKKALDRLYDLYNRRELVHPDPLEFLYRYDDPADREVVGLVASGLAYGRVAQILKSVESVLERMKPAPAQFVDHASLPHLARTYRGFRHRFTSGAELAGLLFGIGLARLHHGSLNECFRAGLTAGGRAGGILPALSAFVAELTAEAGGPLGHLLPSPDDGSACKRLHLFLRWMVRRDQVDLGDWTGVRAADLIVPTDTHMHRVGLALGFTQRKQADERTAIEITEGFKGLCPDDPVRYDFALTRLAIRRDGNLDQFLVECR